MSLLTHFYQTHKELGNTRNTAMSSFRNNIEVQKLGAEVDCESSLPCALRAKLYLYDALCRAFQNIHLKYDFI